MSFPTYATILADIEKALDLEDETFIQSAEMFNYVNEAIRAAEAIINDIHEDYFLTSAALVLISGTSDYALPTDIYANKIRGISYSNGTAKYMIGRIRRNDMFDDINFIDTGAPYRYLMVNDLTAGLKIRLYPTPTEAGSFGTIWYLRNARVITATTDTIDVPEFRSFIQKYAAMKCMLKEGHPNLGSYIADFEDEKQRMISSLTDRVEDNDNEIELDLSHYQEHN